MPIPGTKWVGPEGGVGMWRLYTDTYPARYLASFYKDQQSGWVYSTVSANRALLPASQKWSPLPEDILSIKEMKRYVEAVWRMSR